MNWVKLGKGNLKRMWRQSSELSELWVSDYAKKVKRECFGKGLDYRMMVLREAVTQVTPFLRYAKPMAKPYEERKEYFYSHRGRRHWSNRECFCCKSCGDLHVHHIVALKNGGTNKEINLINLCAQCHSNVHGFGIGGKHPRQLAVVQEKENKIRLVDMAMSKRV